MLNIVIIGAGGFAREVHEMLWDVYSRTDYRFKGFLGHPSSDLRAFGIDRDVLSDPDDYIPQPTDRFLLAIGSMDARQRICDALTAKGAEFLSFVHPRALVASTAQVGAGAVVYPFAVVSNRARVGRLVHLNYYASVGHDSSSGSYCLLAPYATLNGFCTLEDQVYVSTHATVAPGVSIATRSKVSANTAVMKDVPKNTFVFGVPGRQTRLNVWS